MDGNADCNLILGIYAWIWNGLKREPGVIAVFFFFCLVSFGPGFLALNCIYAEIGGTRASCEPQVHEATKE